jgi:hypothetical protein
MLTTSSVHASSVGSIFPPGGKGSVAVKFDGGASQFVCDRAQQKGVPWTKQKTKEPET